MTPESKAGEIAGKWWADRLSDKYADKRSAIASAIADRVSQTFNGIAYWDWWGNRHEGSRKENAVDIECDYEPKGLLADAVLEVFGREMPSYKLFTASQDLFPRKHDLLVTREELRPKEGYGNWTKIIRINEAEQ